MKLLSRIVIDGKQLCLEIDVLRTPPKAPGSLGVRVDITPDVELDVQFLSKLCDSLNLTISRWSAAVDGDFSVGVTKLEPTPVADSVDAAYLLNIARMLIENYMLTAMNDVVHLDEKKPNY